MLKHLNTTPQPPKRTVVIGAGGFVGSAIVRRLEAQGAPVVGIGRGTVDLLQEDASERLAEVFEDGDSVVAVSAIAPVKNTQMLADNMRMVLAMVDALRGAPIAHLVNISSDAVYADGPTPLSEATPMAPTSLHGAMHVAREIAFHSELKMPMAMLRPTLIYGAEDPHNGYGPNRFRRLASAGDKIVLFGEGEEQRDHVLVDDVAEIVLRVLMHKSSGALNVATGEVHSFRDLAQGAARISGNDVVIEGSPRSGPMPHNGYRPFDIAATKAAFPDFDYTPVAKGMEISAERAAG